VDDRDSDEMSERPAEFVGGLAASIAQEKERLKASFVAREVEAPGNRADVSGKLDDLNDEVSELRGRLKTMQASLDALLDEGHAGS